MHPGWTSTTTDKSLGPIHHHIMSEVSHLPSRMPHIPPQPTTPSFNISTAPFGPRTTLLPQDELTMQAHTIFVIVIFCAVCFLLLLAFFYTFCFHCSIRTPPKDLQMTSGCSLDQEDATYRCSSSEIHSVANIV